MDFRSLLKNGAAILVGAIGTFAACSNATELPPRRLSETGLYASGSLEQLAPDVVAFSPQYPLWTDGATKRRWIRLPAGASIDARQPDNWEFPVGTRLWKEFSFGRPVETRMSERLADGSWRFVVYVWNEDGRDADLGPETGIRALPVAGAPGGRYAVPSKGDCAACHEGGAVPVLGFGALQLSPDRDPLAPHAGPRSGDDPDLVALVARGLIRNLPPSLLQHPPRITATSTVERAALGYLHGNCGHCHNDPRDSDAGVPLDFILKQYVTRSDSAATVRASIFGATSRFRAHDNHAAERAAVLKHRMASRDPRVQMPPLGTQVSDTLGLALIERWLSRDNNTPKEKKP